MSWATPVDGAGLLRRLARLGAQQVVQEALEKEQAEHPFRTPEGEVLLSRSSVSEITDELWEEYEAFSQRDLSGLPIVYLVVDGVYEAMRRLGQVRDGILVAWGILEDGRRLLIHLEVGNRESYESCVALAHTHFRRGRAGGAGLAAFLRRHRGSLILSPATTGSGLMSHSPLRIFGPDELRAAVSDEAALEGAEQAFRLLGGGSAVQPPPVGFEMLDKDGEVHVKAAGAPDAGLFTVKVATVFKAAESLELPAMSGLVLAFDAATGQPRALLLDHSWLTDLRTAAAGALALRHLAPEEFSTLLIVGTGIQARLQPRLMSLVRSWDQILIWGRSPERAGVRADGLRDEGHHVSVVRDLQEGVEDAEVIITVTAARKPLVRAQWVRPGATVVAIGSDGPEKRELEAKLLARADKVVTDRTAQCAALGELHHALEAGLVSLEEVYAELGEIVLGEKPGREDYETIVCDLTGVGVQDTVMAGVALERLDAN